MKNTYKVPTKLWKSFSTPLGKQIFNSVFSNTIEIQKLMTHPKMAKISPEHWRTICWNMACKAAWACDEQNKMK